MPIVPRVHDCPTPGKRGWGAKKYAKQQIAKMTKQKDRDTLAAYQCKCGSWHIGHKRGTKRKRLKKLARLT
jgi:hypothetical protein